MIAAHTPFWWIGLVLLGFAVGIIAGMFGVGGGFLLTPMLAVLFRVPLDVAVGTGMCQMIGVGVAALSRHLKLKQGELVIDGLMLPGSLLGVGLGAQTVAILSGIGALRIAGHTIAASHFGLSVAYILTLAFIAFWMGRDSRRPMRPAGEPVPPGPLARLPLPPYVWLPRSEQRVSTLVIAYLGLATGFLSGLLGMGGGAILTPILIYGIGMRTRTAAGTGILVLVATSLVGTAVHAWNGHVHLGMAITLLTGSTIGAQLGAMLTSRTDGQKLRRVFVWLVLFTMAAVVWDLLRVLLAS